ncbi:hypothetical protein SAMN05216266_1173 [Amycolatopsis marina]|uniref:Uncharacterized protein n=1 Tax=Amycolatopsis marina TaxID=490629 RepID=A0A1I1BSI4_9PSEU|nr:hypothetical protein [Amycolatopsis marina]SFB53251.1 hypothetical protein SAMN05216266_1173 [Amycolatopsis marina]
MNTTTNTTAPVTVADRARSVRAGLFLGRGDTSTPIGLLSTYPDTPPPDPATVATLPIGRQLLTATTERDYRAAFVAFAAAWRAGGFGDSHCDHTDPLPDPGTCPPPYGDNTDHWARTAYTFDDGQVLYYRPHPDRRRGGQWHTITLTDSGASAVELTPASRRYGESYRDTAGLDLANLAAWIMGTLTGAAMAGVRYAAAVNPARAEIKLYLYGLDDTPGDGDDRATRVRAALDHVTTVTAHHNWTNPHDDCDHRFRLLPHIVSEHDGPDLRTHGRGPGTVTVVTDPAPFWT